MTLKQRLQEILDWHFYRQVRWDDYEEFRKSGFATLSCLESPLLLAEVDRIDGIMCLGKMTKQAWNKGIKDRPQRLASSRW